MGIGIRGKVVRFGFESNTFVRNTLIYFHANYGDVVPWSALTAVYARRGKLDVARRLFDEMPFKDLVSWNVMITGLGMQSKGRRRVQGSSLMRLGKEM
ncbi:pentatricopeptide repeat-containing protein [Prunus yedoensis var. nudiflora]|uniref:Pentatricopeptide repeat-containing protein n=1 Tax=Prunus yedoensis var. nudiflora TaxID=2094558 RepID=A0A314ZK51_PRUYE|nr:pentatricopeptide repeat-containing protein [Prunus yedoensis var. nudiflora]